MEQPEMNEQKQVIVAVFTGYLSEDMTGRYTEEYIQNQIEKFGYDPNNFNKERFLFTPRFSVRLDTKDDHVSRGPHETLLAIHGSTESAEEAINNLRGSGLIVARYSIFYGGPSQYSGNYPEESGYSLDVPKSVDTVRKMLTTESLLDALVARELGQVTDALAEVNEGLDKPVLATPYLEKALRFER